MTTYTVCVIVGSLRKDSLNKRLAHGLTRLAPQNFQFQFVNIGDLPLYNEEDDANQSLPVKRVKHAIEESDGVLFITPEYNRSIPGVLKNALDHGSRPYSHNSWSKKPAGIIGISLGAMGTSMAQQHLRNILAYLNMPTLGQPEAFLKMSDDFFTEDGDIGEDSRSFLQDWMSQFTKWIALHSKK
ncbi:NADPH-dependent FMN reductase [Polynucleobacter brandtiae]|uniref:Chromate reductase n=1 Tax=Polynucleobacter brandtiae TaxID=1938816 RepID=A0A2M8VJ61_9BURK|nr:NAD(P)H-dependent oxidoreductase [Polynucleobacter brandtiae]PJI76956.1 chromate reductase [Polynucleobacter brandtiae]